MCSNYQNSNSSFLCPPLKNQSVCRSVCRPSDVRSISFDVQSFWNLQRGGGIWYLCFFIYYLFIFSKCCSKQSYTRGYQKVRRLMQWNQSYANRFWGNLKQQMLYQLWKFTLVTLIINHFIIKYILYGMVTRRNLRWVFSFSYIQAKPRNNENVTM